MGTSEGFMKYIRKDNPAIPEEERILNFREFHESLPGFDRELQAARCMDCGVPFCQSGLLIAGMTSGCPLHNLIPEMNDLLCQGNWKKAWERLSVTHSFPEFTGRVCPALCEKACTCGLHDQPVATRENELAVTEYAFSHGFAKEPVPEVRTGKKVAVAGSGPAGLAAAQLLNRRGHLVTVYERKDRPGGLLRYGIPNMKLDKRIIDRRIQLMEEAGVRFICNTDVGKDISADELLNEYDRVILACGASSPRDINVPGREAGGIRFAVDFLSEVTKRLLDSNFTDIPYDLAEGKDVVVIGGGDTGNDCVGTALRLKAASVTQLEMMPKAPDERTKDNPWPQWPRISKTDYGQEEAAAVFGKDPRIYQTTVKEFHKDEKGMLKEITLISLESQTDPESGRRKMVLVEGSERKIPAGLVLIAAGFTGCQAYIAEAFGAELDARTNVLTPEGGFKTTVPGVFTAGDMHRGQSLVVWAITEGRAAARAVDEDLMGYSNL